MEKRGKTVFLSDENVQRAMLLVGMAARTARVSARELASRAKNAFDQATDPDHVLARVLEEKYSALRRAGMSQEDAHGALLKIVKRILDSVAAIQTKPTRR